MFESLPLLTAEATGESFNSAMLFVLAVAIFGGMFGAVISQKLKFPQVVGYIIFGLILGETFLGFVTPGDLKHLEVMTSFALGIIGFMVGGELKFSVFRKYARQFAATMLGEGLGAFLLVTLVTTLIFYLVIGTWTPALAAGLILGAISSATDPASTMDVLWESRSKGIMTTSLVSIIALDDALAMTLYAIGSSAAALLCGGGGSISAELSKIGIEMGGAILVGAVCGVILLGVFRFIWQPDKTLAASLSLIVLVIAVSTRFELDVILACMTLGLVIANGAPRRSEELFVLIRNFSAPIYVFFFVMVGAQLNLGKMPLWLWGIVIAYVLFRTLGKMAGTYLGARITGSDRVVRRYMGLGLFCQGGVAVGLASSASGSLSEIAVGNEYSLGELVVFTVTATTFLVQLIGPSMVKLASKLSGEFGKDVTEADAIAALTLEEVLEADPVVVKNNRPLNEVVKMFSQYEASMFPVCDRTDRLVGVVTLDSMREILTDNEAWSWLVAADVMETEYESMNEGAGFQKVYKYMVEYGLRQMLITSAKDERRTVGVVRLNRLNRAVKSKLLAMQIPEGTPAPAVLMEEGDIAEGR